MEYSLNVVGTTVSHTINTVHDGKVECDNKKQLSCILIGFIFYGMVYFLS